MLILLITSLLVLTGIVSLKEIMIPTDKLPAATGAFIDKYFPGATVSHAKKGAEPLNKKFKVFLQDGTEIRFNAKGKWEKIDCKQSAVPAALIPTSIADHIHSHFPDMSIVKIEKKRYGYALAVSGDEELKFDKKGSLISTDE
ncbi:MAG: PepSY-like domain-containing protein [Bacteroidales bacterium]|jgi:hypothetical protein